MDLKSALAVGVPLLIAATGYVFTSIHTRRRDARAAQLERVNLQLQNLYGPLHILTESRRRTWEAFYQSRLDRPGTLLNRRNLDPDQLTEWRRWVEGVFQPSNVAITEVILSNAHLLEKGAVPSSLLDMVAYTDSYRLAIDRWKEDPSGTYGSFFDFPDEIRKWAARGYMDLKSEQERLLTKKPIKHPSTPKVSPSQLGLRPDTDGRTAIHEAPDLLNDYVVQIVFCIDASGSMGHLVDEAKNLAISMPQKIGQSMEEAGKRVQRLRVRFIAFRDVRYDGDASIEATRFFELPGEQGLLTGFLEGIESRGGGDEPDSGLHALALAIQSDWVSAIPTRSRSIIVLATDASPHSLECWGDWTKETVQLPSSFEDLTEMWEGQDSYLSASAKRLILFAPNSGLWQRVSDDWEQVVHYPSSAGGGLIELQHDEVIRAVISSI